MEEIIVPRLDPEMKTALIVEWLRNEGDRVEKGEPLAVVEGEKVTFEVEAPTSGVLRKIIVEAGREIPVGEVIAIIAAPDEPIPQIEEVPSAAPPEATPPTVSKVRREVKISPAARKLAEEYGIDVSTLTGTGPEGRIVREDVLKALQEKPERAKIVQSSRMRKVIAQRMTHSYQTTPQCTIMMDVDMSQAFKLREARKDVSITAVITKAVAQALTVHQIFNSSYTEEGIKIFEDVNIGVVVAVEEGLLVPVVHNADKKSLSEISQVVDRLVEKARCGTLEIGEITGGTFTISNLGGLGVDVFTPIINPPQSAILGVGRATQRPVVEQGQIVSKPIATFSLVFDHRVSDGAPAASFLKEIKRLVESPYLLLV